MIGPKRLLAPLLVLFPADIQQFVSQPPSLTAADVLVMETMIAVALWPLIVGALLLWRATWNALLQVREQAADARVASWGRAAQRRWAGPCTGSTAFR